MDLGPDDRPVYQEWPDRRERSRTRDLLRKTKSATRSTRKVVRTIRSGTTTRSGRVEFGGVEAGYTVDPNYVRSKDNSTVIIIIAVALFISATAFVAWRTHGFQGSGFILMAAAIIVIYRWYRKHVKPKIDAVVGFTKRLRGK